jgi:pimeloyl-ACP methyl ester carboxylesterase
VSGGAAAEVRTPPTQSGYVNVGLLDMYYERHGSGAPMVLLHGAIGTIESCFATLLPELTPHFEIVAFELQGHGHTRDIDRRFAAGCNAGFLRAVARMGGGGSRRVLRRKQPAQAD